VKLQSTPSLSFASLPLQIPPSSQIIRCYDIHNLTLKLVSNQRQLLRLFDEFFGYFSIPMCSGESSLTLELYAIPSEWASSFQAIPAVWSLYDKTPHISCFYLNQTLLYQYKNQGMFFADIEQGYGLGYIILPYSEQDALDMYRNIWLLALFHMMRAQSIFPLHGSAAMIGEKGVLITGKSGQGKTTLLLHLLKEGFRYLADDTVLLRQAGETPTLLSFPTAIRITTETVKFFPELSSVVKATRPDKREKYCLDIKQFSPIPPGHSAMPALVVLPEITPGQETTLLPLSRMAAAVQCIPQNIPVNKLGVTRNNFEILTRLFQHAQCYQLRLGHNMNSIGRQIAQVIRAV